MIRYLEDDDIEKILLYFKIAPDDLAFLMGNYIGLVCAENSNITNLCFYEPPYVIIKTYGSSDNFLDFLKKEDEIAK